MNFLIDTNIFIKVEPRESDKWEPDYSRAAELHKLILSTSNKLFVHPASMDDLNRDRNKNRRQLRQHLINKYPPLQSPPKPDKDFLNLLPSPKKSNDQVDYKLLYSLYRDCVDFLITEDQGIHSKGKTLKIGHRIATIAEANDIIKDLFSEAPQPPPLVNSHMAYNLDESDNIFHSFRRDYPKFDHWLKKVKKEHRQSWTISGDNGSYAGLCIVKEKDQKRLKICSLKVARKYQGNKYGELLLKTVFDYCYRNRIKSTYVTVFDKYGFLIQLLEKFGFKRLKNKTSLGEFILQKSFDFCVSKYNSMDALEFNRLYGPHAIKYDQPIFIVPIKPTYHAMLFPEIEEQIPCMTKSYGNSIKKAYLCNSVIKLIVPGSILLFYRTSPFQDIVAVGITEKTLRTNDSNLMARFVAKRTVFSMKDIDRLCQKDCLGILFRQSRRLSKPIDLKELFNYGHFKAAPQQIMSDRKVSRKWLLKQIEQRSYYQ